MLARLESQRSSRGHGVACVDGQVHENLLELAGIGLDGFERGVEDADELDVLADQAPQQLLYLDDDGVEVEHCRLKQPVYG